MPTLSVIDRLLLTLALLIGLVSPARADDDISAAGRGVVRIVTIATVEGEVVGHARQVTKEYLRDRGATYYVGHPFFASRPAREGEGFLSAEVDPGLFLIIQILSPDAQLDDRVYPLSETQALLQGWAPVDR